MNKRWENLIRQTNDGAIALKRYLEGGPAITKRIGQGGSTGTTRRYRCNGCGEKLGSESASYPQTVREQERNAAHLETCDVWAYWDRVASILAGSEGPDSSPEIGVALDAALEALK